VNVTREREEPRQRHQCQLLPRREQITPLHHAVALDAEAQRADWRQRLIRHGAKPLLPAALPVIENLLQPLLSLPNGFVIKLGRQAIMPARGTGILPVLSQCDHREQPSSADSHRLEACAVLFEQHVGSAALLG
jgi:hypothetical protein